MKKVFYFVVVLLLAGCVTVVPKIELVSSPNGKQEYKSVVVYPFISTIDNSQQIRLASSAFGTVETTKVKVAEKTLTIMPPMQSVFNITTESKTFNNFLTTALMKLGFSLREGLLEILETNEGESTKYSISLDVLKELHDKYGVEGIIIGDIIFGRDKDGKISVKFVQARLMDIETLILTRTVTYSYEDGESINIVAQKIAEEINASNK